MRKFRLSVLVTIFCAACFAAILPTRTLGQNGPSSATSTPSRTPVKYGIVVDNSGSMRLQLESIIDLVKNIVAENQPGDETFLVRFVSSEKIVLAEEITPEKSTIQEAADAMFIEGGHTSIADAVRFAAKYLDEKTAVDGLVVKALLLITDGDERNSSARLDDLIAELKKSNVKVYAIGISDLKVETRTLDKLTKGTGGKLFLPKGPLERRNSPKSVAAAIHGM